MKKIISMLLVCTMLMTVFLSVNVFADAFDAGHTYIFNFYDADENVLCPSITKGYGSSAVPKYSDTINLPTPTKEGYQFVGWYMGYYGSWNLITDGKYDVDGIASGTFPQTFTMNLYAKWGRVGSGTCGDNLTWKLDVNGTLTISGTGAMNHFNYGTAPWNDYQENISSVVIENGVTTVGHHAFQSYPEINTVKFPGTLTSIGDYAFCDCDGIVEIAIPSSVSNIGVEAFSNTSDLSGITVDGNNQYYTSKDGVLFDKAMKTLLAYPAANGMKWYEIPAGVTAIEIAAFGNAHQLETLTIPSSVTNIPEGTIQHCGNLTSITVDENNQYYTSKDGVLFDKGIKKILSYPPEKATITYEIPNGVTEIGNSAFTVCTNLTSITIPDGVISIGDNAFVYCSSIPSINIPKSVKKIGSYAISWCESLTDVYYAGTETEWNTVVVGEGNTSLENATIHYNSTGTSNGGENNEPLPTSGKFGENLTWSLNENGVFTIKGNGGMLFNKLYNNAPWEGIKNKIKQVIVVDGVTDIGSSAFRNCENLKKVTLPDSITKIGHDAFAYCYSLEEINLPKVLTYMSSGIFYRDSSLKEICIPVSVTHIGQMMFLYANEDLVVSYEGTKEQWSKIDFEIKDNIGVNDENVIFLGDRTPQTIIVSGLPEKTTYGDNTFVLSVTPDETSQLTQFTYKSSNPDVAEIAADGTVTIKAAGETDITVKQAGNDEYAATEKTVKLIVNPITIAVTEIDLENKTASFNGVLEADMADVELDFDKINTTVISTEKSTVEETTTITSTVKLSNFKLKGNKARNYIAADTTIETTVSSTTVSENLTTDENVTIESAPVDEKTIIVTDVNVAEVPEDKKISIDVTAIADTKVNTVAIPKTTVDNIIGIDAEATLEITLKDGSTENNTSTITFDAKALAAIQTAGANANTLSISVDKLEKDELKAAQTAKLDEVSAKSPVVYSLKVVDETGASIASSFGETGTATVKLPYMKPSGDIKAKWLKDSGDVEDVADVLYSASDKCATLKLGHFSEYLIYTEPAITYSGSGGGGGVSTYTVKFETNGGSEIPSVTVNKNKSIPEPTAPTKNGYTFGGWYTDKELTNKYDFTTKVTKSFTLYAKWIENKIETIEPDEKHSPFKDINIDDWFYNAVIFAYEINITSGISETEFAPQGKVTRGQFITMLCRAYDIPEMTGDNFDDCGNTWYTGYLAAAKQLGISNGVGDNKFAPEKEITREEMVTLIYNYLKSVGKADETAKATSFADDDMISDWAKSAVAFASSNEYVNGKENNMFDPQGTATRAELAQIFYNILAE